MRPLWLLFLATLLAACDPAPQGGLSLSPERLGLWAVGQTAQLQLLETGADGQVRTVAADRWESLDTGVATVDDSGRVTAAGPGETRIVARRGAGQAEAVVRVDTDGVPLSGVITFPDPLYDADGFTGEVRMRPLRHARLEVLDDADGVRVQGVTDAQGRFDLGQVIPEGLRLVVYSEGDAGAGYPVSVRDPGNGALFALALPLDGLSGPLEWALSGPPLAAFHLLDVLMKGWDFVAAHSGATLPPLAAFWAPGGAQGTFYCTGAASECPQGRGIYVLESAGDSDAYDDDVLWHEFGHFVSDQLSRDSSPGGCHFLQSLDLDLRLAWSEGWGDFFPAAVKDWLEAQEAGASSLAAGAPTSLYMDTDGVQAGLVSFDVAAASAYYRYASNELAVANVLWQLRARYGMAALWSVIEDYLPIAQGPVNLETFWNGWLVMNPPGGGLPTLEAVFAGRGVEYRDDDYEADDDPAGLRLVSLGADEAHTLYGVGDVDVVGLPLAAGQSVILRTTGLVNGADTQLRVFDPDGVLVADNDDAPDAPPYEDYDALCGSYRPINDGQRLASKVTLSASKSGTYRVEVSSTLDPEPYASAGRYGGYRLRVEAP